MAGIAYNQGFEAMVIGGVCDHVHALLALPPTLPLAKAIQFLKGSSSLGSMSREPATCASLGRKGTGPSA